MKKLHLLMPVMFATAIIGWAVDSTPFHSTIPIFDKNCASCHGKDGKGQTKAGRKAGVKDLTNKEHQASFTDEAAFKAIKEGMKDETGKEQMKPYGDTLTDEEIQLLVAYVRSLAK